MTKKLSDAERKKKLRNIHKRVKTAIEATQHEIASGVFFGTRQSKSQYERQRLALNFEKTEDAICRTLKRNYSNSLASEI